jgi:anthraniloyl-CoA monooxygenase
MERIKAEFVAATVRAERAGFDMVELHCAHGYLFGSFLSPLTNHRTDAYGGSIEDRLRFPLEVFNAMRQAWPSEKPMSVRLSASDWAPGGLTDEDLFEIARAFKDAGCDLIDTSTGQTLPSQKPVYGRMYQVPYAEAVRNVVGIRTMTVGAVTEPSQINTIVACRRADLVALARPHLIDPYFTRRAAGWYGMEPKDTPAPYRSGADQARREGGKAREKQEDLQRRAKPKRHISEAAE